MLDHAVAVDQEGRTQGHARFRVFYAVGLCDFVLDVGDHGEADRPDAALFNGGAAPGEVSELGVYGHADDFHATVSKFL